MRRRDLARVAVGGVLGTASCAALKPPTARAVRVTIILVGALGYGVIPQALGRSPGFLPLFLSFGLSSLLVVTLDWWGRRVAGGENRLTGARSQ